LNNKTIISALIIFLAISFFYLAYTEQKQLNSGDWWALYFENPKSDNLNFVIENHSDKTNFHWEIMAEKEKMKEGNVNITKGDKKSIDISDLNISNKKITVLVSSGDEKKEIYKNR
jgi:hypothetical protein